MRDDTSDSALPRSADHIWLRQSITFAVNGQTRTLELALPLRPGATPDEVESLLDEAEAGMRRLSRRLDAHLAEITRAGQPAIAPTPTAPAPAPAPHREPVTTPAAMPAAAPQPAAASPRAMPAPASVGRLTPQPPAAASTAHGGPDLSRAEFLAAIASELGLDAKTVMERLNVRSLTGLNLRETLDLLRRQIVRESGAPNQPTPAASEPEPLPAPIGRARFDEEDDSPDFEVSYPDPHDLPGADDDGGEEDFAPQEVAPTTPARAADSATRSATRSATGPLSDVPDLDDLDDLLSETPAAPAAPPSVTPAPDLAEAGTRALIATLRAAHAGGQPTEHQRTAYRNIVIGELGPQKAAGVARALWNLTTDRLGPEQLEALIRWGKEDAFAEEVEQVLELLRAEYRAQQAQQEQVAQSAPATPAATPPQRGATQRAAPRERNAGQPVEQPSDAPEEAPARPTPRGRSSATGGAARGARPRGSA